MWPFKNKTEQKFKKISEIEWAYVLKQLEMMRVCVGNNLKCIENNTELNRIQCETIAKIGDSIS